MIDDTLEITNYEDSRCMDQSNPYFSNSHATEKYHDSSTAAVLQHINVKTSMTKQGNRSSLIYAVSRI